MALFAWSVEMANSSCLMTFLFGLVRHAGGISRIVPISELIPTNRVFPALAVKVVG